MIEWINIAYTYTDTLQTTYPDLAPFQSPGTKLLHYHGESDPSVPAASSVHYWQSVRAVMYPDLSDDEAIAALAD
jgi:tannase